MHKFFRVFDILFRIFTRPLKGAERRISITPIIQHIFGDDTDKKKYRNANVVAYISIHQKYMQALHDKIYQLRNIYDDNQSITDLLIPHRLVQQQGFILFNGDYHANGDTFVHTLQLAREGADNFFFNLDDVDTIDSEIQDHELNDYELEDSILYQH